MEGFLRLVEWGWGIWGRRSERGALCFGELLVNAEPDGCAKNGQGVQSGRAFERPSAIGG